MRTDISHAVWVQKQGSCKDICHPHYMGVEEMYKNLHCSLLNHRVPCVLSQLKMTAKESFSVSEVLSYLFDH